ncbi:RNA recognition motif 2 containing protein [Tubulinosema ratisbonensis]|uniref:RNA recognition motif 2 containing protein n=1 Tax=Tubulinosema ratisbonensis TaxID=291195 RepID=A0A437AKT2_9MICR|nr:RNA recognition motif 2 containing protein [Tubulinosema ratisbonensis]
MRNTSRKENEDTNLYFDFLFKGIMNQKEEYSEIVERAKLTYNSVKATEQEIKTDPPKFPSLKIGEKKEFFVWDVNDNENRGSQERNMDVEKKQTNTFVPEQIKEMFKNEIYNETQNEIHNLNTFYLNKHLTYKPQPISRPRHINYDQLKINIDDIVNRVDIRKTCMIKNIPNKYTADMIISLLNEDHFGEYNFLYLRMDFVNECNVGYAFVNFMSCHSVITFYKKIHGKKWNSFSSHKIAELTYATMQRIEQIKNKFKNSSILQEKESYRPKFFYTKGPRKGEEIKSNEK